MCLNVSSQGKQSVVGVGAGLALAMVSLRELTHLTNTKTANPYLMATSTVFQKTKREEMRSLIFQSRKDRMTNAFSL